MAGRRTNFALLVLLPLAVASGATAFAVGSGWGRWPTVGHGMIGMGVVVLSPWKSVVVRRGAARRRPWRLASAAFAVLVATALGSGLAHSSGLVRLGPVTTMQLHVGAALAALPLLLVHTATRRERLRRADLSRRQLLRAAALAGASTVAYGMLEGALGLASLPGARRRFTGSHEKGSFQPGRMPVTQWLDDDVPEVDTRWWRLEVRGAGRDRIWSYDELAAFSDRLDATLDCTGGWWSTQQWEGVLLSRLVGVEGRSIAVTSRTGYGRRFPLAEADALLLATRVGGRPLSSGHGFPARIVAPGRRGFWWVKWVESVEVSDVPWWAQSPFPLT